MSLSTVTPSSPSRTSDTPTVEIRRTTPVGARTGRGASRRGRPTKSLHPPWLLRRGKGLWPKNGPLSSKVSSCRVNRPRTLFRRRSVLDPLSVFRSGRVKHPRPKRVTRDLSRPDVWLVTRPQTQRNLSIGSRRLARRLRRVEDFVFVCFEWNEGRLVFFVVPLHLSRTPRPHKIPFSYRRSDKGVPHLQCSSSSVVEHFPRRTPISTSYSSRPGTGTLGAGNLVDGTWTGGLTGEGTPFTTLTNQSPKLQWVGPL